MGSGNLLLLKTRYFKDGGAGAQCSRVTWPRMPWAVSCDRTLYHASGGESKVFYQRMVSDFYRYIAKFTDGDEKAVSVENARKAYADAVVVAEKDLAVTHPIRLGLALDYSVFQYEV
ncbi:unnamed protein product [Polarella glacialis]|uniref:14-3-3 domain-containing protein n=1 Tax=Polarella glacialis TaxID=89957 RepID=A0A813H1C3_POLGL|nr:unnamed protein product [Polarella glacialis]CAE8661478.1 unnamed protein product [Polarella glacialis]